MKETEKISSVFDCEIVVMNIDGIKKWIFDYCPEGCLLVKDEKPYLLLDFVVYEEPVLNLHIRKEALDALSFYPKGRVNVWDNTELD
jgi:hypothetical protein